ncbi:MAG: hypothetical protein ACTSVY_04040 [Candidatus Helarchaeota archaeon]
MIFATSVTLPTIFFLRALMASTRSFRFDRITTAVMVPPTETAKTIITKN